MSGSAAISLSSENRFWVSGAGAGSMINTFTSLPSEPGGSWTSSRLPGSTLVVMCRADCMWLAPLVTGYGCEYVRVLFYRWRSVISDRAGWTESLLVTVVRFCFSEMRCWVMKGMRII